MIIKSDYIRDTLSYIQSKVKNDTKQKMYGINVTAEYIFMHVLNDAFGYNFINANDIEHNFPAIDLIDTTNKIVMQVTSSTSVDKVRTSTIEKFQKLIKEDAYKKYADYKVMMFYIKDKPKFSPTIIQEFTDKGLPPSHFLGIEDINTKVSTDLNAAEKVHARLKQIFDDKRKHKIYTFIVSGVLISLIIFLIYQNSNLLDSSEEQKIAEKSTHQKLDLLLDALPLYGNKEKFLKEYFGDDWTKALNNSQTYHNLKIKLLNNQNVEVLLKEKEELLKKIATQSLKGSVQKMVDKALMELRYDDVRDLLDNFIENNQEIGDDLIKAHYQKALTFMEEFRYQKAKAEFETFIPIGIEDANILNEYGTMYYALGDYKKAEPLYNKALNIREKLLGVEHPSTAASYNHLAGLYKSIGDYKKAEALYNKALKYVKSYLEKSIPLLLFLIVT